MLVSSLRLCLCLCHLDNIVVGEQDVAESDVPVKDSLLGQVPQTSRHLNFDIRRRYLQMRMGASRMNMDGPEF